ncbi:MAG: saccharopine dehydrogenase NADP-binding domain-containing protein [Deltaproteobacteria bacterium]|nr:saccharopine dehydrogenase NADP-binding domain-containing protein [Deltaproteobacteria bacterium]MBW2015826.1 saccharopine dehydrogenase NADP-binding domain-containing protein [Deltaproteobacteria bacterium]MBW2128861.1 saccharopine dehydrogenase NADP-binding domain-containing protein [Deltaproteobacteria bacterium]MBW2304448.1 saccharopine dehydrogenase NADP-binding domain-containing protein [Deltaproteobacteria bacterium]
MRFVVLGTGLVGNAIVRDLAGDPGNEVLAVDRHQAALDNLGALERVEKVCADIQEPGLAASLLNHADVVVSAVPGCLGFETLSEILSVGKPVVDISFFPEDPFQLDGLAREKGVTAVVDCGVAPGLCNILAGYVESLLDHVDRYVCYVGGLPKRREWPFEYKAVFSPADVLEEYTRPVHLLEYGQEVVRPALSEVELLDFPGIGTLEAFNTDGLRTLRKTIRAPFMTEKTLRYPGHARLISVLKKGGFFRTTPVDVNGCSVIPMELTAALLREKWRLEPGEEDLTVMKVILEGRKGAKGYRYTFDLLDTYDQETQTTSMARTTGYTCAIVARWIADGFYQGRGICPPEYLGRHRPSYENLLREYEKRHIIIEETVEEFDFSAISPDPGSRS